MMSEYTKLRMNYINNWPNSSLFFHEKEYISKCEKFKAENNHEPFLPMKIWLDSDVEYNKVMSFLIEALNMMPYSPNHAFSFMFTGFDLFSNKKMGKNITDRIRDICKLFSSLIQTNLDVSDVFSMLFESIPISALSYFYKTLYDNPKDTRTLNRLKSCRGSLEDEIYNKYGYYNKSNIRKASTLYRIILKQRTINLNSKIRNVFDEYKLMIIYSGIVYSLRNDSFHGASISSTKSSKTTLRRYALNYYCFIAIYISTMVLLIYYSKGIDTIKKYKELKLNVQQNFENMRLLFGSNINR